MAKITIKSTDEVALQLSQLEANTDAICKRAIYKGAKVVANQIRKNAEALPTDRNRFLEGGDKFNVLTPRHKEDLLDSLGISSAALDGKGNWNVKIGFDGYGTIPTTAYPKGLPNALLARAVESGSSVRNKKPFVRPSVAQAKNEAKQAMQESINDDVQKIVK